MVYCISDIHGEYNLFMKLLDNINFCDDDIMLVLGDMIDKGPDSVKLLKYLFSKDNIICIMGNHEYDFLKYYNGLMLKHEDYDFVLEKLKSYFADGNLLDWDVIDKIEELPLYLKFEDYICVHSGVLLDTEGNMIDLKKGKPEDFVYNRRFKDLNRPVSEKCIIFGHTPVRYINDKDDIIFYKREGKPGNKISDYYKIHIDCGVYLSNRLGCICIDSCKAYYVEE